MSNVSDGQITLSDGRRLGYADYGDGAGQPIMYFHGYPGSRLEARLIDGPARLAGVRVIAPDRPGMGLSDFQPGRAILDWPADVAELADSLGLDKCAAVGVSGGGPYLCACAAKMSERLSGAALICPLGPVDGPGADRQMQAIHRFGLFLARRAPAVLERIFDAGARTVYRYPHRLISRLAARLAGPDAAALQRPEVAAAVADSFGEAARSGGQGIAWDLQLLSGPWGFRLQDISIPVHLCHGERDRVVPISMGLKQAEAIPNCYATYYPDEGHFSLPVNRMGEILHALTR